jgi:hypothetical protein
MYKYTSELRANELGIYVLSVLSLSPPKPAGLDPPIFRRRKSLGIFELQKNKYILEIFFGNFLGEFFGGFFVLDFFP